MEVDSYDGTVEFEDWLKDEADNALKAVYRAEVRLIDAQNALTMAQDGKIGVWEYLAEKEEALAEKKTRYFAFFH